MPHTPPFPEPRGSLPRRSGRIGKNLGRAFLRSIGWHIAGQLPDLPKAVIIVAPHTSNWDFVIGIAAMFALGVRVSWLGKHTIFGALLGPLMRWLGGIPVDRRAPGGVVEQAVESFRGEPSLLLGLSPEGTRKPVPRWHRGFLHIAHGAGVPIVPVTFDYRRRRIVLADPVEPGSGVEADLDALRPFFSHTSPRRPDGWVADFE